MTKRTRIFIGILVAYALGVAFLMYRQLGDIDPRYRESTEDSLVETAQLMASLVETASPDGTLHVDALAPLFRTVYARRFVADIYGVEKTRVELRMTVVDRNGIVVFDRARPPHRREQRGRPAHRRRPPRRFRRSSAPTIRAGTTSSSRCAAATERARPLTSKATRAPR